MWPIAADAARERPRVASSCGEGGSASGERRGGGGDVRASRRDVGDEPRRWSCHSCWCHAIGETAGLRAFAHGPGRILFHGRSEAYLLLRRTAKQRGTVPAQD